VKIPHFTFVYFFKFLSQAYHQIRAFLQSKQKDKNMQGDAAHRPAIDLLYDLALCPLEQNDRALSAICADRDERFGSGFS